MHWFVCESIIRHWIQNWIKHWLYFDLRALRTWLKNESSAVIAGHVEVGQNLSHSRDYDLRSDYFAVDSDHKQKRQYNATECEEQVIEERLNERHLRSGRIANPLNRTDHCTDARRQQQNPPPPGLRLKTSDHFCESPFKRFQIWNTGNQLRAHESVLRSQKRAQRASDGMRAVANGCHSTGLHINDQYLRVRCPKTFVRTSAPIQSHANQTSDTSDTTDNNDNTVAQSASLIDEQLFGDESKQKP